MKYNGKPFVAILWLLSLLFGISSSAHILFLHTCVSYSHRVSGWPLVESLIHRGHHVTFIGPYSPMKEHSLASNSNLTEIVPRPLNQFVQEVINANFDVTNRAAGLTPKFVMIYDYVCYESCKRLLGSDEIKQWLKTKPKIDLVYADTSADCSYGLAAKLGAKNAIILPVTFLSKHAEAFGISPESATIPDWDVTFKFPLTFFKRTFQSIIPLIWRLLQMCFYPFYKELFRKELGLEDMKGLPELQDAQEKTSIIMINGDYLEDYPRSYPPMVIKVPAMHVKTKHNPLSKDLEDFVSSKESDGFMYISFGTVAKGPNLPLEIRNIFFKAIEAFPTIRFIWRWDGKNPDSYPKNLLLKKYVEQEDLLAHGRIKGFLTQGGRLSLLESSRNAVPTITFPILAEQDFNAGRFELLGTSIGLDIVDVTVDSLKNAIAQLLTNTTYKERAIQISKLAKDVPMKSIELAVWWTEFVIRHTQEELSLLRPLTQQTTWYQRRELDTWGFLLILFLIALKINFMIGKWIFRKIFSKTPKINKAKRS